MINKGKLPNLLIIGARKCGTTSLHYYLNLHPQISMAKEKEIHFFAIDDIWNNGIDWYKSKFSPTSKIRGEASTSYTNFPLTQGVPEKIFKMLPDVKFIYIIGDPIDRILSDYIHDFTAGTEDREINEVLRVTTNNPYIIRSKYYMQLEQFLDYFPFSSILLLTKEELSKSRYSCLSKIYNFLDVDDKFASKNFARELHLSSHKRRKTKFGLKITENVIFKKLDNLPINLRYKIKNTLLFPFSHPYSPPLIEEQVVRILTDHLKNDLDSLRILTGREFKGWLE